MYICPSVKNYDTGYLLTRKQIRENSVHCGAGGGGGGGGGGREFSESSAFRDFNKKKRQKACNKTIVYIGDLVLNCM